MPRRGEKKNSKKETEKMGAGGVKLGAIEIKRVGLIIGRAGMFRGVFPRGQEKLRRRGEGAPGVILGNCWEKIVGSLGKANSGLGILPEPFGGQHCKL